MTNKKQRALLLLIGAFFVLIGIIAIINSIQRKNIDQIFWFCYTSILLIGVGILIKNPNLINTQLNILTIPSLFWGIDFIYQLINNQPLWGITNYFFIESNLLFKLVSSQHLFTVPLSLFVLYTMKLDRKDMWKISIVQVGIIFALVFSLTTPGKNINCIFNSCISFINVGGYAYQGIWLASFFLMILITNYMLIKLPFLKKKIQSNITKISI